MPSGNLDLVPDGDSCVYILITYLGDGASLTAAAAELAEVAVAPGVDESLVGQRQRLGVAAAARHLHHPLAGERLHLLGLERGR